VGTDVVGEPNRSMARRRDRRRRLIALRACADDSEWGAVEDSAKIMAPATLPDQAICCLVSNAGPGKVWVCLAQTVRQGSTSVVPDRRAVWPIRPRPSHGLQGRCWKRMFMIPGVCRANTPKGPETTRDLVRLLCRG